MMLQEFLSHYAVFRNFLILGFSFLRITSLVIVHSETSLLDGISYIMSCIDFSKIDLRALAPVLRLIATFTISSIASLVKFNET